MNPSCCSDSPRCDWEVSRFFGRTGGDRRMVPEQLPDPVAVALNFASLLERFGIAYLVGGSGAW